MRNKDSSRAERRKKNRQTVDDISLHMYGGSEGQTLVDSHYARKLNARQAGTKTRGGKDLAGHIAAVWLSTGRK